MEDEQEHPVDRPELQPVPAPGRDNRLFLRRGYHNILLFCQDARRSFPKYELHRADLDRSGYNRKVLGRGKLPIGLIAGLCGWPIFDASGFTSQ